MGEEEGSPRGKAGGSVPTDDGDGGPDDELDGEVGGVDELTELREDGEGEPEDGDRGRKADREDDAEGEDEDMEN